MVAKPGKVARLTRKLQKARRAQAKLIEELRNAQQARKRFAALSEAAKVRDQFDKSVRASFWIAEAKKVSRSGHNPYNWMFLDGSVNNNLSRMRKGLPPIGPDNLPMHVHHIQPISAGGTNA